jgi:2'-5' RNA ligase
MPQTLLFGETPGGLSTDGDSHRKIWANVVSAYQQFAIYEQALRLAEILYAQTDGPTKGIAPEAWTLTFDPLDEPTREEIAGIAKTHAETDQIRINAGITTPDHVAKERFSESGYRDEIGPMDDVEDLPDPEDAEADADVQQMIADAAERRDASNSALCLLIPVSQDGLASHAEWKRAAEEIAGPLEHGEAPHVTVLYLGEVSPEKDQEVIEAVRPVFEEKEPIRMVPRGVAFLGDQQNGAVVLKHEAWDLDYLHGRVLKELAHIVTAKQHPHYRPHETLGYQKGLSADVVGRLLELQPSWVEHAEDAGWVASRVELRRGDEVLAVFPFLGNRRDGEDAEDSYKVPEGARNNARKALRWREEYPDEIKGMTEVGWRRARQLASQVSVGLSTVKRMAAFNRHRKNSAVDPALKETPWKDAGYVAWLGWGGTTGVDWARGITGAVEDGEE